MFFWLGFLVGFFGVIWVCWLIGVFVWVFLWVFSGLFDFFFVGFGVFWVVFWVFCSFGFLVGFFLLLLHCFVLFVFLIVSLLSNPEKG